MKQKLFFLLPALMFFMAVNAQSDFEVIKQRVLAEILNSQANDDEVAILFETVREDGSWPGINYEDVSNTGFENRYHLENMREMSLAFNEEESEFYQSEELADLINRALEFWCVHDFFCENWWWNQIGTPTGLVTVLLIMDNHIYHG